MVSTALSDSSLETRVVDAAVRCIARWGVAKTTLDDVAREAGCSRATVYRAFPGGKEGLLDGVARTELNRFFDRVVSVIERAPTLEELLVLGITEANRALTGHEALQFLLRHEPEVVLPNITFHRAELVLGAVAAFATPYLAPYVGDDDAPTLAEWVARLVLSYTLCPSEAHDLSSVDDVRRLLRTFVLPGIPSAPSLPTLSQQGA
ncbi:MAG: TetR/AcrR family transcriptional regulator [Actinomycetota bacterium]